MREGFESIVCRIPTWCFAWRLCCKGTLLQWYDNRSRWHWVTGRCHFSRIQHRRDTRTEIAGRAIYDWQGTEDHQIGEGECPADKRDPIERRAEWSEIKAGVGNL